uniref:Fibroblast growth factor binding protein 2 n=2 Tax=Latimeria chalumnae TaxID=7897 RepID=H3A2C1_LATCH
MKLATLAILLIICCLWGVEGEKAKRTKKRKNGEEKLKFQTKRKDSCTMIISGQPETKLRIECKNKGNSYWCEYTGKPSVCPPFTTNPKLYWNQISSELKKAPNACQVTAELKPGMCAKTPEDASMKQVASSLQPTHASTTQPPAKPTAQKQVPRRRSKAASVVQGKAKKAQKPAQVAPKPTQRGKAKAAPDKSEAKKMARRYCWELFQDLCSYVFEG